MTRIILEELIAWLGRMSSKDHFSDLGSCCAKLNDPSVHRAHTLTHTHTHTRTHSRAHTHTHTHMFRGMHRLGMELRLRTHSDFTWTPFL